MGAGPSQEGTTGESPASGLSAAASSASSTPPPPPSDLSSAKQSHHLLRRRDKKPSKSKPATDKTQQPPPDTSATTTSPPSSAAATGAATAVATAATAPAPPLGGKGDPAPPDGAAPAQSAAAAAAAAAATKVHRRSSHVSLPEHTVVLDDVQKLLAGSGAQSAGHGQLLLQQLLHANTPTTGSALTHRSETDRFSLDTDSHFGQGSFGQVFHGIDNHTRGQVAIKKMPRRPASEREARVLAAVSAERPHKNVVRCVAISEDDNWTYIVMEACRGEDVCTLIDATGGLAEPLVQDITRQLLSALHHIHRVGIAHRDVKPDNILYDTATHTLKLCDFGFATWWKPGQLLNDFPGTLQYSPPEVLRGEPYDGAKRDIWSLGCTIYVMLLCRLPFGIEANTNTRQRILLQEPEFDDILQLAHSPEETAKYGQIVQMIDMCLRKNPDERSGIKALRYHEWLGGESERLRRHARHHEKRKNRKEAQSALVARQPSATSPTHSPTVNQLVFRSPSQGSPVLSDAILPDRTRNTDEDRISCSTPTQSGSPVVRAYGANRSPISQNLVHDPSKPTSPVRGRVASAV